MLRCHNEAVVKGLNTTHRNREKTSTRCTMSVRRDPNIAMERISLRMKIRKALMFRKPKQAPEDLYYTDPLLYICLFLVFLLPAEEFKFYTIIFSFPPQSALSLHSSHDGFWQTAFILFLKYSVSFFKSLPTPPH